GAGRLEARVTVGERSRTLDRDEGPDARRALALEIAEVAEILAEPEPEPAPRPEPAPDPQPDPEPPRRVSVGAGAELFFDDDARALGGFFSLSVGLGPRLTLRALGRALAVRNQLPGRRGDAGLGLELALSRPGRAWLGLELLGWVGARRAEANGRSDRLLTVGGTLTPILRVRLGPLVLGLGPRLWLGRRLDVRRAAGARSRGAVWALGPVLELRL
ncbi:MAG: hypothetical protein AAGH15_27255, partial [Myxococcota bacterium]